MHSVLLSIIGSGDMTTSRWESRCSYNATTAESMWNQYRYTLTTF